MGRLDAGGGHPRGGRGAGARSADRQEKGPRQQGASVRRWPGACAGVDRAVSLDDVSGRRRQSAFVYARVPRRARVRRCLSRRSGKRWPAAPRRSAEPAALRRPVDLSRRRHPGEGRSDEHGDVARDTRAVSRRRGDGAGVLDARQSEDPGRHAQVHPQAGDAWFAARSYPRPQEGRLQHSDEAVVEAGAASR